MIPFFFVSQSGIEMINRRNLIWSIPLVILITFPIWRIPAAAFFKPRGGYDPANDIKEGASYDFSMRHITITENQLGKRTAVIKSELARTGDRKNEYLLENVNADIFNNAGEVTNIIAQRGTYNVETEKLTLKKDVKVTRMETGDRMFTDHLIYSNGKRLVESPGKTRFVGESFNIVSGRMTYHVDDSSYNLSERVKCIFYTSESL